MYEAFYGLRERPFDLTPNPRFLLLTGKHREAISNLQYGLESGRGLTLLVGDAGTGKTTVVRAVLEKFEQQGARVAYLNNPTLTRAEFYEFLAGAFDLSEAAARSKVTLLRELQIKLAEYRRQHSLTALVIDEVQAMPDELLEEVRLLANLETATEKLLPIVLSGQPELAERLNKQSLRQLKQRVSLRCELGPLDARETAEYIAGRIRIAGGNSVLVFTRQSVELIYRHSAGIPRLISVICDNSLISGFAADRRPVDREIVADVCRDFDLHRAGSTPGQRHAFHLETSREKAELPRAPANVPDAKAQPEKAEAKGLFEHFNIRRRFSLF
jgi:general secretion pathway protein A